MTRVLCIQPDGSHEVKNLAGDERDGGPGLLEQLQAEVGGYIEGLTTSEVVLYFNEDGKYLKGMAPNPLATRLVDRLFPGFARRDVIVGPMLVLGRGAGGSEKSVPDDIVELVKSL